jgi:hypothetical protein
LVHANRLESGIRDEDRCFILRTIEVLAGDEAKPFVNVSGIFVADGLSLPASFNVLQILLNRLIESEAIGICRSDVRDGRGRKNIDRLNGLWWKKHRHDWFEGFLLCPRTCDSGSLGE